jgi:hypothetical protein
MYLERLEMTMGKMEIEELELILIYPLHLGAKQDVYTKSEKLNTTKLTNWVSATKKQSPIMSTKNWLQRTNVK